VLRAGAGRGQRRRVKESPNYEALPLITLPDTVIFPHILSTVVLIGDRAVAALDAVEESDSKRVFIAWAKEEQDGPLDPPHESLGTVAEVIQVARSEAGLARVIVEGLEEAEIVGHHDNGDFTLVEVRPRPEPDLQPSQLEAAKNLLAKFAEPGGGGLPLSAEAQRGLLDENDAASFLYVLANEIARRPDHRQAILKESDGEGKLRVVMGRLLSNRQLQELEEKIESEARKQIDKQQQEYFLNEQLRAIERELGGGEGEPELQKLEKRARELPLSEEAKEKFQYELKRLTRMPAMSPEAVVSRTYLETLLGLPWGVYHEDDTDILKAGLTLDSGHHGLEKVKERILEFLAVVHQTKTIRGPILCLVGPPGVGKTTLGQSVAKALGRKFVRVALGGVRDEAEIRGHRRTYVSALPGKIISGMKKAGVMNPVFLLDEIDKMTNDMRGDPAAALLEVLDPEQNHTFTDHYMEIEFDLSRVLFIATANSQSAIPAALLDRMEVLRLAGYTEEEKVEIALRHLLPRQLAEHGLAPDVLKLPLETIHFMTRSYTREAGVRELDRLVAKLCRKTVLIRQQEAQSDKRKKKRTAPTGVLSPNDVRALAGPPKFHDSDVAREPEIGLVQGLAWTEVGGELLPVETVVMQGQGKIALTLTGKMGDVMQESARAALAYLRRHSERLGIPPNFHLDRDLHVHLPEGAIPKDGPSAGVALLLSMASALSGRPVRQDVAVTGEITLRGRVLRIGGLKEKVLAAHRQGIFRVVCPAENRDDLDELPASVRSAMTIHLAGTLDDVLPQMLMPLPGTESLKPAPKTRKAPVPKGPMPSSRHRGSRSTIGA